MGLLCGVSAPTNRHSAFLTASSTFPRSDLTLRPLYTPQRLLRPPCDLACDPSPVTSPVASPVTPALLPPPTALQVSSDAPLSSHPEPRPHGSHTCDVLPPTISLENRPSWTPPPGRLPGLLQVTPQHASLGQYITHNRCVTAHATCPRRRPRQTRLSPVCRSPSKTRGHGSDRTPATKGPNGVGSAQSSGGLGPWASGAESSEGRDGREGLWWAPASPTAPRPARWLRCFSGRSRRLQQTDGQRDRPGVCISTSQGASLRPTQPCPGKGGAPARKKAAAGSPRPERGHVAAPHCPGPGGARPPAAFMAVPSGRESGWEPPWPQPASSRRGRLCCHLRTCSPRPRPGVGRFLSQRGSPQCVITKARASPTGRACGGPASCWDRVPQGPLLLVTGSFAKEGLTFPARMPVTAPRCAQT